jgi:hypothetical protein
MRDTNDGKEKFIKHCHRCDSLLVGVKSGEKLNRLFYEVGSNSAKTTESKCVSYEYETGRAHPRDRRKCKHSFLEVASSRVTEKVGKELLQTLKESAANSLLGGIDHEAVAFGRRYIWCSKCGLFYGLPKYKEKDLKEVGINEDWYV